MIRLNQIRLPLDHSEDDLRAAILRRLKIKPADLRSFHIFRRGHDARRRDSIRLVYTVDVETTDDTRLLKRAGRNRNIARTPDMTYRFVARAPEDLPQRPVIVGTGPCGMFAALVLAQMGFRPRIIERGQPVRPRTRDTWEFWRKGKLHPESNVQFGEGGAGTFSDGKLYSRIRDSNQRARKVLAEFVKAGAPAEILYVARPHIGTFKLVKMVENIRREIESLGGRYEFGRRVVDLVLRDRSLAGVLLDDGTRIETDHVALAIGHSARDTFEMLQARGVHLEQKPFSIGVRIEHPQSMIDACRYGRSAGNEILGAADYQLVHHCRNGRSVYSFCMCPGGTVVAAASEPGRVVTNGMSQYSRNERNANAGLVVGIEPGDFPGDDPLAGVRLQRDLEQRAFEAGGSDYAAPGQLVGDFLAGRPSTKLGEVIPSYTPRVKLTDLATVLPAFVVTALREALPAFDRQIPGYARADAVMTGVETRTSSPIRITRDEHLQSVNTPGLFPGGEGAGYAGGILSAAVDGLKIGEAIALSMGEGVKT